MDKILLFLGLCLSLFCVMFILLSLIVFKSMTYDRYRKFLNFRISNKIEKIKINNVENENFSENDLIEFLEKSKMQSLDFNFFYIENIIGKLCILYKKLSLIQYQKLINESYKKEIDKIIKENFKYKNFMYIMNRTHFDLNELDFLFEDPKIILIARKNNLINDNNLTLLYQNVYYSKTNYIDEDENKYLNDIREKILHFLESLIKIKKEN